jgi:mRNA interferase MazF
VIRRGDVVTVVLAGDYGKPRPAVVIQSDALNREEPDSFVVAPLTSSLTGQTRIRVAVTATAANGLELDSEVMTEKLSAVAQRRIGRTIGRLDPATLARVDQELLLVLGFA